MSELTSTADADAGLPPRQPLIVASNRGPVSWRRDDAGRWTPKKGAGGLIVALGGALQQRPGTWVSVALDDADRAVAAEHDGNAFDADTGQGRFRLRLVDVGSAYDAYYNDTANRLLWFTLHQLWPEPYLPIGMGWRAPFADYLAVNERLAEAVITEAREAIDAGLGTPEIHLQDYHLLTAAPHIRRALPDAPILQYIHTPWVHPTYFRRLPDPMTEAILKGLASCDVVGISAPEWRRSLRDCMVELADAELIAESSGSTTLQTDGRSLEIREFVLGIDADSLAEVAASSQAQAEATALRASIGDRQLIVRADRTDLSKNILRGLAAYEIILQRRADLLDRVHFRVLLNLSRQGVPEYRDYLQRCLAKADAIRARFGDEVLLVDTEQNFPRVVAALGAYDVLLTNPVIDGTNLVAKEGPSLNERDGVLVLSRNAGAAEQMEGALLVNPFDVEQTADALEEALDMPMQERARRAASLKAAASLGSPAEWLQGQQEALAAATSR